MQSRTDRRSTTCVRMLSSLAFMALLVAVSVAQGRQPTGAAFDVASVKPSDPASRISPSLSIGPDSLVVADYSLRTLINQAYGVTSKQVERLPRWAETERFSIRARSQHPSSRAEILDMLRALLAERFHLKVRRESREVDVYVLTVDREKYPGPGVHPVTIDCATNTLSTHSAPGVFPPGVPRPRCGVVLRSTAVPDKTRTTKSKQDLYAAFEFSQFVTLLEGSLSRPLRDQTGLAGTFDLELNYSEAMNPAGEKGWLLITVTDTLVRDALRNQLGLVLTSGRAAMDVLVIDSVERPSPD